MDFASSNALWPYIFEKNLFRFALQCILSWFKIGLKCNTIHFKFIFQTHQSQKCTLGVTDSPPQANSFSSDKLQKNWAWWIPALSHKCCFRGIISKIFKISNVVDYVTILSAHWAQLQYIVLKSALKTVFLHVILPSNQ